MDVLQRIHASTYTLLTERSRSFIDEADTMNVARAPLDCIQLISHFIDDDRGVFSEFESLFPACSFDAAAIIFQKIIDGNEITNVVKHASYGFNMVNNPLRLMARVAVKQIEDSNEYLRARPIIQRDGLPIVLAAIDEMLNRGVSDEAINNAIYCAHAYTNGYIDEQGLLCNNHDEESLEILLEQFDSLVLYNWSSGGVVGKLDTTEARIGKTVGGVGGALAGAKLGAVIGSVVPGPGTVLGAAVGGAMGNFLGKSFGEGAGVQYKDENKGDEVNLMIKDVRSALKKWF